MQIAHLPYADGQKHVLFGGHVTLQHDILADGCVATDEDSVGPVDLGLLVDSVARGGL